VLLGYSKEQIIDLIGIPDGHLDENDQLVQGIDYASIELKKLEKRKEELSITKQTRTINEIEMLSEYIKKIKIIKSGVFEEPLARPSIRFEDKEKMFDRPLRAISTRTEKKTTQHPVKVMSFFLAGFALVILFGSYFYYQTSQKEPVHSEKTRVLEAPVPMDQIAKTQREVQETQRSVQSFSDIQQGGLIAESTKSSSESTQTTEMSPVVGNVTLVPEKEAPDNLEVEEMPKAYVQKKVEGESLSVKTAPTVPVDNTLTTAMSKPERERAPDIEVKETPGSESGEKASPSQDNVSLVPEKQRHDITKVEGDQIDEVEQEAGPEGLKEKAMPDVAGEETLMTAKPEVGEEKVVEAKAKPILSESEKITSKENINQQQNELSRLKAFLKNYCQAYSNKDFDKFITLFASDATENNIPFQEALPSYRKHMETMESLTYRIELTSFSKQTASENIMVRGKFFTRFQVQKGGWEENSGDIFMELTKNGNSFLVKQLNY
jgi:hypothetical protein